MEAVCAAVAIAGAAALGYWIGHSVTRSRLLVILGGLFVGGCAILLFFMTTFVLHKVFPNLVDPWNLGRYLIVVGVFAPLGGAIAAAVSRHRVARADAARLPF
jgi:Zn-dependent protease with chaperone function